MAPPGQERKPSRPRKAKARSHHREEPEPLALTIGQRIRALRKEREISFDALVGMSGLGRGYLSELERGLAMPSASTLLRVADALSVSASHFLGELSRPASDRAKLANLVATLSDESVGRLLALAEKLSLKDRSEE